MKVSQELKTQMENVIVKNLTDDEVNEIINVNNIIVGRKTLENFSALVKFGTPIDREDRVSWEVLNEKAPEYIALMNEVQGFDGVEDINDGKFDTVFLDDDKFQEELDEILEEEEFEEADVLQKAREQLVNLQGAGLKINRNLTWDVWKILRMYRLEEYLKQQGNNIDFLIELYSYIPAKKMKRIRKRYNKQFDNE